MRKKVAVLGCGPAGLLAAHAAARAGAEVDIFSKIQKSRIGGAQYLYMAIPGITSDVPDGTCIIYKRGEGHRYADRVYGDHNARTSWANYQDEQVVEIWNMQQAYERLWDVYGYGIIDTDVNPQLLYEDGGLIDSYHYVISCIPRMLLCIKGDHDFHSQQVWISTSGPEESAINWIEYNGLSYPAPDWYRASCLFGYSSFEYSQRPILANVVPVRKPLYHDCDCWEHWPTLKFMGRYGAWQKNKLIHHAYQETKELLT